MPVRKMPDAETVRRLYWDEGLSPREIGVLYDASEHTVHTRMLRDGIPMRSKSEGLKLAHQKGVAHKRPPSERPLKDRLVCRECRWIWKRLTVATREPCPQCGHVTESRIRKGGPKRTNTVRFRQSPEQRSKHRHDRRRSVLLLVGRGVIACVRCGCDRPELLEVNHRHGGGSQEVKAIGPAQFYTSIVALRRVVDDLELCCKVCNALHYLELKHGALPYRVTWSADDTDAANV